MAMLTVPEAQTQPVLLTDISPLVSISRHESVGHRVSQYSDIGIL